MSVADSDSINNADIHSDENVDDDDDTVHGVVDYAGRPAKRSQSGYWKSACYIISSGIAEKFAYFGIGTNLITYLTGPLRQPTATAASHVNIWLGTGSLLPLLGAFMADSFLGRYRTIIVASLVYILALGLLTISAFLNGQSTQRINWLPPNNQLQVSFFFFSLYLVQLGQGTHKPCIIAFGADQFDEQCLMEQQGRSSFFNWWYFGLSAGPLTALIALNYIQDNVSWGLGFGIPCVSMIISLIIFLFGTKSYRYRTKVDEKCPLIRFGQVFVKAAANWRSKPSPVAYDEEQGTVPQLYSEQFKFLNKALLSPDGSRYGEPCSIQEVEEAKTLLKLIPIWASSLAYAIALSQITTLFTAQGIVMDRSIGLRFAIPAASLQYLVAISIIISLPIYDRILVPVSRMITGIQSGITKLQRIGIGLVLCIISMSSAALVERKKLKIALLHGILDLSKAKVPMTFWWLIPQYIIFGLTEVFTLIGLQEFFYDQMPCDLKSIGLSIYLSICGIGNFLSSFLICTIEKFTSEDGEGGWFSNNTSRAHIDYFFWLLAGLNAVGFLSFLYFSKSLNYSSSPCNIVRT